MSKKKIIDPIPEEFNSYEEAADFWDTHDTTDYPNDFRTVKVTAELKRRRYEVEIDEDLVKRLRVRARRRKITISRLANDLIRRQLPMNK